MTTPDDDQRRDALLREVMRQPPESRAEMQERLRRERQAKPKTTARSAAETPTA